MASTVLKAAVPPPSADSLAFRASLAHLISPLRRVRPRVPFFQLAIHRIPTLTLYRNLLRYAPDENVRLLHIVCPPAVLNLSPSRADPYPCAISFSKTPARDWDRENEEGALEGIQGQR
jgi:hypothetical protein